jgi:hypothetical protein
MTAIMSDRRKIRGTSVHLLRGVRIGHYSSCTNAPSCCCQMSHFGSNVRTVACLFCRLVTDNGCHTWARKSKKPGGTAQDVAAKGVSNASQVTNRSVTMSHSCRACPSLASKCAGVSRKWTRGVPLYHGGMHLSVPGCGCINHGVATDASFVGHTIFRIHCFHHLWPSPLANEVRRGFMGLVIC